MAMVGGYDEVVVESVSQDNSQLSQLTPSSQASQDLRLRVAPPPGKSRSTEKVMDKSRRSRCIAGVTNVGTDDEEEIDQSFASKIKASAVLLRFDCWNETTGAEVPYVGQAGFLRNPKNRDEVKLATCMHNLVTDVNQDGQLEFCQTPHKCVLHNSTAANIHIPNTGWRKNTSHALTLRNGVKWSSGIDLSLGPSMNGYCPVDPLESRKLKLFLQKVQTFDVVCDSFQYKVGLKIGIVVYKTASDEEAFSEVGGVDGIDVTDTWANRTNGIRKLKYEKVLGADESVMIYTGIITKGDNDHHIEYNVNTFKGCSGAIIIVMQRDNADFGKALGVHAGYKDALRHNIGFKLAGAFDREV